MLLQHPNNEKNSNAVYYGALDDISNFFIRYVFIFILYLYRHRIERLILIMIVYS